MVNIFQKKVLILAIYAGEIMMKNGAEVYRVEDTITRICKGLPHGSCGDFRYANRDFCVSG